MFAGCVNISATNTSEDNGAALRSVFLDALKTSCDEMGTLLFLKQFKSSDQCKIVDILTEIVPLSNIAWGYLLDLFLGKLRNSSIYHAAFLRLYEACVGVNCKPMEVVDRLREIGSGKDGNSVYIKIILNEGGICDSLGNTSRVVAELDLKFKGMRVDHVCAIDQDSFNESRPEVVDDSLLI